MRRSMNGPRFSISFLLLMVVVIGIGLAAMTHPSDLWSSVLFSVMMLALSHGDRRDSPGPRTPQGLLDRLRRLRLGLLGDEFRSLDCA